MSSQPPEGSVLTVAVLAGGQSRRMGKDKALLETGGKSLLQHVVGAALAAGFPVLVVGRPEQNLAACLPAGANVVYDVVPEQGPLVGLLTALENTSTSVLLTACDVPCILPGDFLWLGSIATEENAGKHGVIATQDGQPEPLFGVYRSTVVPLIRELKEKGQLSMRALLEAGEFAYVPVPPEHLSAVQDVDTPADLQAINRKER